MSKKTFEVSEFREDINTRLDNPKIDQDSKEIMCILLEDVLHKTGNYKGYVNTEDWYGKKLGKYTRFYL